MSGDLCTPDDDGDNLKLVPQSIILTYLLAVAHPVKTLKIGICAPNITELRREPRPLTHSVYVN